MMESPLFLLAWVAVIAVQAAVHFFIFGARRRCRDRDDLRLLTTDVPKDDASKLLSQSSSDCAPRMIEHNFDEDEDDEEAEDTSFDGDEPKLFFDLLDQTGSEMVKVSFSREHASSSQK
jgi:hypothetical protein